jgi:hypothetical protein
MNHKWGRQLILAWLGAQLITTSVAQVVINEIHYDPDIKTEPVEFIELHNPGPTSIDVSGWELSSGVAFTFPQGTLLAAGAYLVVAQDPTALLAKFGVTAFGPWSGKLSNDGERIELRDASGTVVDQVEYRRGFPWPTVGDPPGYSIELVHPSFDNDLGGNWRASYVGNPTTPEGVLLVSDQSTWRYFKGFTEASSPSSAWRQMGFNDSGWLSGAAPIGYGESFIATELSDMQGNYTSVFLRKTFTVEDPLQFGALLIEAQYDDGFKAWINGVNVIDAQANMPAGDVPHTATANSAIEDYDFSTFSIASQAPGILQPGLNVLAIQAHNANLGVSSDFFIDVRLLAQPAGSAGRGPTPGARNAVFAENIAPQIRQVRHLPGQPAGSQPVLITAKITDPEGVGLVSLDYQVVDPGNYIELSDPAYASDWDTLTMNDQGTGGDAQAGDSIYSVTLPSSVQVHRRLVRYRIRATDGLGLEVQVPYPDDPQPNFAYFVYNGIPGWRGSVRPGVEPVQEFPAAEMGRLPAYHLLSKQSSVENSTWFSRYQGDQYLWSGTLVHDGTVYDHIRYRARGGVWRYAMCKNMWKFRFNRGHEFQAYDNWGNPLTQKWTRLNLGASIQQGDYGHRGEQGMFESVGFRLFNLAGVEAPHTAFVSFRVIDAVQEADPLDQFTGDFWGVYLVTEQIDGRFLDEHDLPDGNLYKMEHGTGPSGANGELANQGPDQVSDSSDLIAFRTAAEGANNRSDDWWRTNLDLPRYYSYQAILQAIHHYDVCCGKNYYYYHHPHTGQWSVLPWDLDLSWDDGMYVSGTSGGTEPFRSRLLSDFSSLPSRPQITIEFKNRVREIRDLLFNTDQTGQLIDEYAALLRGPAAGPTLLDADRAMWDYNPKMISSTYSTSPGSKAGHGRFYQAGTPTRNFAGMVQKMKNYVHYRASVASLSSAGSGLDGLARDNQIPATPTLTATHPEGFPINRLTFQSSPYAGTHAFVTREWRLAEVTPLDVPIYDPTRPRRYEVQADWESGPIPSLHELSISIPASAVRVGSTYRVRTRVTDATGRASHWSPAIQFVAEPPDNEVALVEYLRLTELMYQPLGGSDWEFIELHNRSTETAIDLNAAKFTDGIDFAFGPETSIPPGGYLLVVAAESTDDFASFRNHYGLDRSVAITGPYTGRLDNAGELLTLKAGRAGTEIVAFHYNRGRGWPLAAMGPGHSLVPLDRAMSVQSSGSLDYPGNWRPSTFIGGSPGRADPEPPVPPVLLNEIVAHTDYEGPLEPRPLSNDWIELFNPATVPVTLENWYLSDTPANPLRWAMPAVTIPARGYLSFDEVTGFNQPTNPGFGLNKAGEQVLLSHFPETGVGRVVDSIRFEGQENEVSLGRFPEGGTDWYPMDRTRDLRNLEPHQNVVLSEIMYRPRPHDDGSDNVRDQYLELFNPTPRSVTLSHAAGAWRIGGGIRFLFPPEVSVAPGEAILIVSFDPANDATALSQFRQSYQLNPTVRLLGPFEGRLRNRGENVAIERPQAPDAIGDSESWVIVDEVIYGNQDPWPSDANGTGLTLQRLTPNRSGNNPANWIAALPSPGSASSTIQDTDGDGLPDDWEIAYGLDPLDPADALLDSDQDGLNNRDEFLAGTDPLDPSSLLRLEWALGPGPAIMLRFTAMPGRSYIVQHRETSSTAAWLDLEEVPAAAEIRRIEIAADQWTGSVHGFYRVQMPLAP